MVRVMADFHQKKTDILLATTIIENGLDLPNANTLIVDDAAKLGLSQAYQIRGRVGRAKEQAFAQAEIELKDIDLAQLYDCFTGEVLFQLEDYGWCKKGEGGPFAASGAIGLHGSIPTNTSGGMLSEAYVHGMNVVAEAVIQLRQEAGPTQVPDAEVAIVTSGASTIGSACILTV